MRHRPRTIPLLFLLAVLLTLAPSVNALGAGATLTLSPATGPPTTRVTAYGTGFGAAEVVDIRFDTRLVGTASTDGSGAFSIRVAVPKLALPGTHQVKAKGESSGLTAQATFTVRTDWPTFHFGLDRTGYNRYENVLSPTNVAGLVPKWIAPLNGIVNTSPVIVRGVAFVGTQSGNSGTLYAIDTASGSTIWTHDFTTCAESPSVAGGIVYVATCLGDSVVALKASTGDVLWEKSAGAGVFNSPAVTGGIAYFGADDGSLYAVDAVTGQTLWTNPDGGIGLGGPAVVGGVVYHVAAYGPRLVALDGLTGTILWSTALPNFSENSPAVSGGMVYVGMANGPPYRGLSAYLQANGDPLWNQRAQNNIASTPAVANGLVYVGSVDDSVYAYDAITGALVWSTPTGDEVWASPDVANGVVYIGSKDGKVYALDALNGNVLWTWATGGWVITAPAVSDGVLYVGSWDDNLYAFHLP